MSTILPVGEATGCAVCLDTGDCWLCYGSGQVLDRGRVVRCLPCDGSGSCLAHFHMPRQWRRVVQDDAPATRTARVPLPTKTTRGAIRRRLPGAAGAR